MMKKTIETFRSLYPNGRIEKKFHILDLKKLMLEVCIYTTSDTLIANAFSNLLTIAKAENIREVDEEVTEQAFLSSGLMPHLLNPITPAKTMENQPHMQEVTGAAKATTPVKQTVCSEEKNNKENISKTTPASTEEKKIDGLVDKANETKNAVVVKVEQKLKEQPVQQQPTQQQTVQQQTAQQQPVQQQTAQQQPVQQQPAQQQPVQQQTAQQQPVQQQTAQQETVQQTVEQSQGDKPLQGTVDRKPDMPVEEILNSMTYEEALEVVIPSGFHKEKTLGCITAETPKALTFYMDSYVGNNIVKAAACIIHKMSTEQQIA